jgi:hypothetical protein
VNSQFVWSGESGEQARYRQIRPTEAIADKLGKDYYLVRKGDSNQCSVVTGKWEEKPEGAIGGAPYASEEYAKAALKTFAACKGGEADEDESKQKKK